MFKKNCFWLISKINNFLTSSNFALLFFETRSYSLNWWGPPPSPSPPPSSSCSSSSISTTAHCGLWPVEQCPSIFSYLQPTLSIFSLPALEDLFLLPLSISSCVFPFFSSFPVVQWRYFWASYQWRHSWPFINAKPSSPRNQFHDNEQSQHRTVRTEKSLISSRNYDSPMEPTVSMSSTHKPCTASYPETDKFFSHSFTSCFFNTHPTTSNFYWVMKQKLVFSFKLQ